MDHSSLTTSEWCCLQLTLPEWSHPLHNFWHPDLHFRLDFSSSGSAGTSNSIGPKFAHLFLSLYACLHEGHCHSLLHSRQKLEIILEASLNLTSPRKFISKFCEFYFHRIICFPHLLLIPIALGQTLIIFCLGHRSWLPSCCFWALSVHSLLQHDTWAPRGLSRCWLNEWMNELWVAIACSEEKCREIVCSWLSLFLSGSLFSTSSSLSGDDSVLNTFRV